MSRLLFLLALLPLALSQCTFCLPECTQPAFPGTFCTTAVLSIRAKVSSNSTQVCTSVCDGKGIALGNLKTVYVLDIVEVFRGTTEGKSLKAAGIFSFATDPLRSGVTMEVGKEYFVNLQKPMDLPGISQFLYIDRCDAPRLWDDLTPEEMKFLQAGTC